MTPHESLAARMVQRIEHATRVSADVTDARARVAGRTEWDASDTAFAWTLRRDMLMRPRNNTTPLRIVRITTTEEHEP